MTNYQQIWAKTKQKLVDQNIKSANYHRTLLREHMACRIENNANASVHFDKERNQYYIECTDCVLYFKEDKKDE